MSRADAGEPHEILEAMQAVMGTLPGKDRRVPLDVRVEEELPLPGVVRRKLSFAVEPGDRVPAYLFLPEVVKTELPGMLCLHQTTAIGKSEPAGLGGNPNLHYALELAKEGMITLAPDYPGYGDYKTDAYALGYVSTTMKGIWNHRCALDLLESLPEVDVGRLGSIGHSLGGHNTLFVAAFDERVRVAVTSCGFTSFSKYMGGDLSGWSHDGYMPRIAGRYGKDPAQMPFDFPDILTVIAPRAVFVNAPVSDANFEISGVKDCLKIVRPLYEKAQAGSFLAAVHPDCEHDFPATARAAAYAFIRKVLAD